MIEQPKPNSKYRMRYLRWVTRLREMCEAYRRLEAAIGTGREAGLRRKFHDAAHEPDRLVTPAPWASWERLGDAIHGSKARPRTG